MSSSKDTPTPWDDERITAYVMNELDDESKQTFESELQTNAPLAAAVEEARQVTSKLAGFYGSLSTETLGQDRLRSVLKGTNEPASFPSPVPPSPLPPSPVLPSRNRPRKPWLGFLIAASIVLVLAGISVPMMTDSSTRNVAMTSVDENGTTNFNAESDESEIAGGTSSDVATANADRSSLRSPGEPSRLPVAGSTRLAAPDSAAPFSAAPDSAAKDKTVAAVPSSRELQATTASPQQPVPRALPTAVKEVAPAIAWSRSGGNDLLGDTSQIQSPRFPRGHDSAIESMDVDVDVDMGMGMGMDMNMAMGREMRGNMRTDMSMGMGMDMDMGMDMGMDMQSEMGMGMGAMPEIDSNFNFPRMDRSGDKYDSLVENTFQRVVDQPLSTLSIDVDTASYSKIRMSLQRNQLPPADAVRIEEMINYFEYNYEKVSDTFNQDTGEPDPFSASLDVTQCPWQPEHRLVRVGLQAIEFEKQDRPRCNLVFLIDTSGSMQSAGKLPLLVEGMKRMIGELREDDQVAIVVYAGSAGLVLDSTPAKKRKKIRNALSMLKAGGSTNGGAGLRLAYETARENFIKDGVNRVILCSDGDFNVGMTGTEELVREAKSQAKSGVELTVLGFGMGNHNDAMMERISNDAEGNYAFIDTIAESKKVLGEQLAGTLVTVAKDVKIQIEFNPAVVSAYRLIGYENRLLAKEDFNDDTKDAGEIGSGHRVTALYQVVPVGATSDPTMQNVDPLKYQTPKRVAKPDPELAADTSGEMMTLKLRYKPPQGDKSTLMTRTLIDANVPEDGSKFADADDDFRFAAAVAGFGMQLRGSSMKGTWTYDDVLEVAEGARGKDDHGLRAEMVELIATARRLAR